MLPCVCSVIDHRWRQNVVKTKIRFPIRKQYSWTPTSTKRKDSKETQSLICVLISKPTETFQYTHVASCHPQGVKKGFITGEALRLLRTNSSKIIFEEKITNFKAHLLQRGYPEDLINTTLSEVNFKDRKLALQQKPKTNQRILPFVTQYQPSVPNLKQILMKNWHLIEQQPLLREICKKPPLVSYKRGRSLTRTYSWEPNYKKAILTRAGESCRPVNPILHCLWHVSLLFPLFFFCWAFTRLYCK